MNASHYPYGHWVLIGLAAYMLLMLGIGWYASRQVTNSSDFLVAGRRLGNFLGTGALFATWFGAGTAMGGAGNAYIFGNQGVIFDPWGAGLCLLLVGLFFARLMRRGRFVTLVDLYNSRYGLRMGALAGISMLAAEIGWVGAMLVGFGTIIEFFTGLPLAWGIGISTVIMVLYTLLGGMWAVTLTDTLQMIILIVGMLVMLITAVPQLGGWGNLLGSGDGVANLMDLQQWAFMPTRADGFMGYHGSMGWMYWAAAWMAVGLGSIAAPDLSQRVLAAKDEHTSVTNCLLACALYVTVGLAPVLLGMLYFQADPGLSIDDASNKLLLFMAAHFLNPVTITVFVAALVAALMSSAAGSVLASASIIGYNGLKLIKPDADEKTTLLATRIAIPVVTGGSLWLAVSFQTIYNLMVMSWTVLLVSLFASYAGALFWRRANQAGAIAAYVGGMAGWIGAYFYFLPATRAANTDVLASMPGVYQPWAMWDAVYIASVWGLAASVACLVLVSLATQRWNKPRLLVDIDGQPMREAGWFGPRRWFSRRQTMPGLSSSQA